MDVLTIIQQEHRDVQALFKEAETLEPHDERLRELAQQIVEQLSLHATAPTKKRIASTCSRPTPNMP